MPRRREQRLAGILEQFPQWRKYWQLIVGAAAMFGVNPDETLAVHIFENSAADPDVRGPLAKGAQAVGLAQIWDKRISSQSNKRGWKKLALKWGLKDGQDISDLKTNAEFSIDYLAWRMAGLRGKYKDVDSWYRGPGYNPGFTGDARGPGPSIYLADNARSRISFSSDDVPFPVSGHSLDDVISVWGDPRDGGHRKHEGVDIGAPFGTPLLAVEDGVVSLSYGGLGGNAVHINNKYYYAHLQSFARGLSNGQRVKKGDVIGFVGNSGAPNTPPHLHFSIYLGKRGGKDRRAIDPMGFLKRSLSMPAGAMAEWVESGENPSSSPLEDLLFRDREPDVELPGGGPALPGGGPALPGGDSVLPGEPDPEDWSMEPWREAEEESRRRRIANAWKLIASQEDAGPEAHSHAEAGSHHHAGTAGEAF
jgi:murein DD-endopeptidase MepM/ murein hydrolase activator NlpD